MAVNTAKRRQAVAKAESFMKGDERVLTQENYMSDLLHSLNYYNSNHDDKDKKKWFISHYAKIDKKIAVELLKVDEYHFRTPGVLARLMDLGSELQEAEMTHYNKGIEKLVAQIEVRQKSQDKQDKKDAVTAALVAAQPSIQYRMEEKARELAGDIDGAIDDFVINKASEFSAKNYLLSKEVAAPIAKRIGDMYGNLSTELREAIEGKDEQLTEGYSHFSKKELKKFADFVDNIITDCQQQVQTAKANRAPRKRKEITPTKQVARMKFLREFAELNLKSISPTGIIGSSEVWIYNTKYRKIQKYVADGGTISVKGTTLVGFNVTDSISLTLRKPEEFFKGLSMGKRALSNAIKPIKTKPTVPNGRVNEECIILGAF